MKRKMAAVLREMTGAQREKIRAAAEGYGFEVRFFDTAEEDPAYLKEAEVLFGHLPQIAGDTPKLKWLCTPFAGVDQFLAKDAFANPETLLTNSSGAYGVTISEHTVMILLEILRRQPDYRRLVNAHEWRRDLTVRSVKDSRITLLGTGDIGRETAARLRAFAPANLTGINRSGRNPGGFDRILTAADWETVLPETDVLIISLPGTKEAFHMLGKKQLSLLPDGAVIINVGRGSVIDQEALLAELRSGRLYAGLDVFEKEPLAKDDPVWDTPNLLITPHTAGNMTLKYTVEKTVEQFVENLGNYCEGKPLKHLVDRERGY
ncbi:MAG: D-2-hydroxyacid dehydrogenase [Clostridia bacterium]|nr:D-2-hydroxyacid dehydrogenase [Clostridia bacterium]